MSKLEELIELATENLTEGIKPIAEAPEAAQIVKEYVDIVPHQSLSIAKMTIKNSLGHTLHFKKMDAIQKALTYSFDSYTASINSVQNNINLELTRGNKSKNIMEELATTDIDTLINISDVMANKINTKGTGKWQR